MSSFFLLKYKKRFPTKKVISKIYLNHLAKFSWQKKNKIEKIFEENKKEKNHMMLLWQMINYFFWAKKYL